MKAAFTFLLLNWGDRPGVLGLSQCLPPLRSLPDSQRGPGSILHIPALLQHFCTRVFPLSAASSPTPPCSYAPSFLVPLELIIKEKKKVDCSSVSFPYAVAFFQLVSPQLLRSPMYGPPPHMLSPRTALHKPTCRQMQALLCGMKEEGLPI